MIPGILNYITYQVVRASMGIPPIHGAEIIVRILTDPELKKQWKQELKDLAGRLMYVVLYF